MNDDERKYLAGRVAALGFAIAALIDHLATKDPGLRREMAALLRAFAQDEDGDDHRGVKTALDAIARQLDGFEKLRNGPGPHLRLVEKETDQDD